MLTQRPLRASPEGHGDDEVMLMGLEAESFAK
jgi:hypothetical protein